MYFHYMVVRSKNNTIKMNHFYIQPKLLQWIEALFLLVLGFIPALVIIEMGYSRPLIYL